MSKYNFQSNNSDELIVVRSNDYQTGNASNFHIGLQSAIIPETDEHLEVSIHTASIPMSYYIINTNNRSFTISANYDGTDYTSIVNLPIGNPQSTTGAGTVDVDIQQIIATNIQAFIDDNSLKIDATTGGIDEYTGEMSLTFAVDATIGHTLTITLDMGTNTSLQHIIGLDSSTITYTFVVGDAGNDVVYDSDMIVNCGGLDTIFIRSDLSSGLSYETRLGGKSDILGQVVIDTTNFSYALIRPFESVIVVKLSLGRKLDRFSLILSDINGDTIDLNGFHWSCVLRVRHVKPSLREHEMIDESGRIQHKGVNSIRPPIRKH